MPGVLHRDGNEEINSGGGGISAEKAKQMLGWNPHAVGILEDLRYGSYALPGINP
jgi:hypothetical protein